MRILNKLFNFLNEEKLNPVEIDGHLTDTSDQKSDETMINENQNDEEILLQEETIEDGLSQKIEDLYNSYLWSLSSNELLKDYIEEYSYEEVFLFYLFLYEEMNTREQNFFSAMIAFFKKKENMTKFQSSSDVEKYFNENMLKLDTVYVEYAETELIFFNEYYIWSYKTKRYGNCAGKISPNDKNKIENRYEIDGFEYRITLGENVIFMETNEKQIFEDYFHSLPHTIDEEFRTMLQTVKVYRLLEEQKMMLKNYLREFPEEIFLDINKFITFESELSVYFDNKTLYQHIRETSPIDRSNYMNRLSNELKKSFSNLIVLFSRSLNMEEELVLAIIWPELIKQAIHLYGSEWDLEYGKKESIEIDEEYDNYLSINELLHTQRDNVTKFTCYLIYKGYLKYGHYPDNISEVYANINKRIENRDLIAMKKRLCTPVKEQNKSLFQFNDVDLMSGYEFEEFIGDLFKKMGYLVSITKKSGDQGIDVIVEKQEVRIGLQTKCYSQKVGNSAIQEVVAGLSYHNCNKGLVITNNYFTNSAIDLAYKNNVILWNRDVLKEKCSEILNNMGSC